MGPLWRSILCMRVGRQQGRPRRSGKVGRGRGGELGCEGGGSWVVAGASTTLSCVCGSGRVTLNRHDFLLPLLF